MTGVKLDKKDSMRALLTDTLPGEVPLIFSNDGLYINLQAKIQNHLIVDNEIFDSFFREILEGESASTPFKYSINKNQFSLRGLSLIHPRSQINYCKFYAKFSDVLIELCSRSRISIRAPERVSNSYFLHDEDPSYSYKEVDIDVIEKELYRKHSSSYFTYRGFNRLHKFFSSKKYLLLEKRFSSLWMVDIANCFDSIYTHTISWAIKNKNYVKQHIEYKNLFAAEFDRLIQRSNNNETNGIPIGAEVSRVFAELIFQQVDQKIIKKASSLEGMEFGVNYEIYRYVDDYVIFSRSDRESNKIAEIISDCLEEYNLYVNEGKLQKLQRPFITKKSRVINDLKNILTDLDKSIFEKKTISGKNFLWPKPILKKEAVYKFYIDKVKYACSLNSSSYSDISSYLISSLSKRVVRIASDYSSFSTEADKDKNGLYRDTLLLLLEMMFFLYTVDPQVNSSYKLAKTIIIVDRFFLAKAPEFINHYRTKIMSYVEVLPIESGIDSLRERRAPLETINIILATSEFGNNFLLSKELLLKIYKKTKPTYFNLISLLYYIRDHQVFFGLKQDIEKDVISIIKSSAPLGKNSEVAHLFLDSLSCPFISIGTKQNLLEDYIARYDASLGTSQVKLNEYIDVLNNIFWFVKWNALDLVKLLERKELINTY